MNCLAALVCELTGNSIVSYSAAVHNCNINVQIHIVKEIVQSVCRKISCVGCLLADKSLALRIVVVESHGCITDYLTQAFINICNPVIFDGFH